MRFLNYSSTADGRLADWFTRSLTAYAAGGSVDVGDFDLADITLQAPPPGAAVPLPQVFQWKRRSATPSDSYEFNLFDPNGNAFFYTIPPLGYVDNYRLNGLPAGFSVKKPYGWFIATYSPDGGYGESFYYQMVTFSTSGQKIAGAQQLREAVKPGDLQYPPPVHRGALSTQSGK